MKKLSIAVHKFTSCDGCQLQFLNMEQELLTLAARVQIDHFWEASSAIGKGPWDVSFVEGSISSVENLERARHIRENSRLLIAIGACAAAGGIQALRNWGERHGAFMRSAYPQPEYVDSLAYSMPFSDHVAVDLELPGCPPDARQLRHVLNDLLAGVSSSVPTEAVCMECKRRGHVCVLVAKDQPCLGPVTRTGCGALCPAQERDCYGCFGPRDGDNIEAMSRRFKGLGLDGEAVARRYRFIYNWAPQLRAAAKTWKVKTATAEPLPRPEKKS